MVSRFYEKNGAVYYIANGRHYGMKLQEAEEKLEELESAIKEAKSKQDG